MLVSRAPLHPQLERRKDRLRAATEQVMVSLDLLTHWGLVGGARTEEVGGCMGFAVWEYCHLVTTNRVGGVASNGAPTRDGKNMRLLRSDPIRVRTQ